MISTVTMTMTTVATLAASASLGALASILLILLLSAKEVVTDGARRVFAVFGRSLNNRHIATANDVHADCSHQKPRSNRIVLGVPSNFKF